MNSERRLDEMRKVEREFVQTCQKNPTAGQYRTRVDAGEQERHVLKDIINRLAWQLDQLRLQRLKDVQKPASPDDTPEARPRYCLHGRNPEECEHCLAESDFQFDAARERRIFGNG